jgi:hypothetical protein
MTWPVAVLLARRSKVSQGGVPVVPYNQFVHDFINVEPGAYARKRFNRTFYGTIFLGGFLFAMATVDHRILEDAWFARPDLKPFPAMVPGAREMDITERTMWDAHH